MEYMVDLDVDILLDPLKYQELDILPNLSVANSFLVGHLS